MTKTTNDWKKRAEAHVAKRDAGIPKEYLVDLSAHGVTPSPHLKEAIPRSDDPDAVASIYPADSVIGVPRKALSIEDVAITETPITKLVELLSGGQLSSVRATQAFLRRAILAHQLTNCCTEVFPEYSLKRAQECDDYLAKHKKPIGLLHGLPISLKDQFHITGIVTTMGYVKNVDNVAKQNSVITDVLLRAGAVPLVRTNVPQTLMRGETDNHIFGRTSNPFNRSFTPGGSSGGEGALVGLHGSPLGVGTDIGGSVRIPSAFNGLWGLRPSMHRVPYEGAENSLKGQYAIYSVIGPLTHSLDGVVLFMRAVLGERPWELDPLLVPMPFNEEAYALKNVAFTGHNADKLCFAIEWDDGVVHPHPPIKRALSHVRDSLLAAGHSVIDWKPFGHDTAYHTALQFFMADGGEDIKRACEESGEPSLEHVEEGSLQHLSTYENWQVSARRDAYRKAYLDHWQATKAHTGTGRPVDAIVAPVASWAACPHDGNDYLAYTAHWNLLDQPVVVMPVTHVDEEKDKAVELENAYSARDQELWDRYDAKKWHGLPVNVGLVGKRLQDEELLGLARIVSQSGATINQV